jgi:hypothetical protein
MSISETFVLLNQIIEFVAVRNVAPGGNLVLATTCHYPFESVCQLRARITAKSEATNRRLLPVGVVDEVLEDQTPIICCRFVVDVFFAGEVERVLRT